MLDGFESLSLDSGALVVALVSGVVAAAATRLSDDKPSELLTFGTPLVLACSLYWLPAALWADSSELRAWAPLSIVPWYLVGLGVFSSVAFLARKRMGKEGEHG